MHKVNSTWIGDSSIRPEIIKHIEENAGKTFHYLGFKNVLGYLTPMIKKTKVGKSKWDYVNLKHFYTVRD